MAEITGNSFKKSAVNLGFLLFLSGCGLAPVHNDFNAVEKFQQEYSGDILSVPEGQPQWQDSFPSKNLHDDLVKLIRQNHEVEAAAARVEQAVAAHRVEYSFLFPSIDAGAGFDRSKIGGNSSQAEHVTGNIFSLSGIMKWEPDIWGQLRAKEKASSLTVKEREALLDKKKLDLQDLLVQAWINYHVSKKLENVLAEQHETNLDFLALTENYYKHGQGSSIDILQQQGRLLATEKAMPEIINKKKSAANAYRVLMGTVPNGADLIDDELPSIEELTVVASPFELFINRADLRAGFLALQVADRNLAASVAERFPRLSLGVSYGRNRQSFSSVETETVLNLTSSLLAPIFDAGRLKAQMNLREAEVCESLALLEQTVLEAVSEVEDAVNREQGLFDKQKILKRQILKAQKTVDNARLFYINGKGSYLTVLSSLIDLQNLQVEETELQEELLINRCSLLRALGAGWSIKHES